MNLPEAFEHFILTVSFVLLCLSFYLIFRLRKTKTILAQREELQKQKVYQVTILKEIQDKIGYSLNIEEVVDVITGSLNNLFSYSAASSLLLKENSLLFKIHLAETVNRTFIEEVKKSTLASLSALYGSIPNELTEEVSGLKTDEAKIKELSSFFHIPLIINGKVVGIITISSTTPNLYKEEEMTILYQITSEASTALTRLNEVLETEKGKLISLISGLADGVFMVNVKKEILIVNKTARNLLEIEKEALGFSDIVNAFKDQYDLTSKIDEVITKKVCVEDKEITIEGKTFNIYITPVFALKEAKVNEIIGVSVLIRDITLEKQIDTIKQDFVNMIVHEIRAPLTGIRASSELLLQGNLDKTDEQQMLKIIDLKSRFLLDQIALVLDAAKIEAKSFTVQKVRGDIRQTINEVVESLRPLAIKKAISIQVEIPDNLPDVSFDPVRITQVMNNLISNSLKFTKDNGKITITTKQTNGFLDVSVSDNGIGIPKNEQKDIFSKYYQIRTTPQQLVKKGTGLGLYIVKGIVEAHDGTVWLESEENKGTTVSFSLPIPIPDHFNYHKV